jgi:transcriptional regulator with XRE-family HTH domain
LDLQKLRQAVDVSRERLAERTDVHRYQIWLIESGRRTATQDETRALVNGLAGLLEQRMVDFYDVLLEEVTG